MFVVDGGVSAIPSSSHDSGSGEDEDASEHGSEDDADEDEDDEQQAQEPQTSNPPSKPRKPPAWDDPDDTTLRVSLATDKRLRKLRDDPEEDTVGGHEYERRLRRQFERINPTPTWATAARKKLKKRRRSDGEEEEEDAEGAVESLLNSTEGIVDAGKRGGRELEKGTLAIERLRDANQSAKAEGEIKALQFHPSPRIPALLVASADRRVQLFNVSRVCMLFARIHTN